MNRDVKLLILSIQRCYEHGVIGLRRKKPLDFVETANLLGTHRNIGASLIADYLLDVSSGPTRAENLLYNFVPSDCLPLMEDPPALEAHVRRKYRNAYKEFRQWREAPQAYFKDELTQENLRRLDAARGHGQELRSIIRQAQAAGVIPLPAERVAMQNAESQLQAVLCPGAAKTIDLSSPETGQSR